MAEPTKSSPALRKLADLTKNMPKGEDYDKAWQEVIQGSDRVSALLATAWLDVQLETSLRLSFAKYCEKEDLNSLFGVQAPLVNFAAKCNLSYALGLFGRVTLSALLDIAKVRNVFAHSPSVVSFETPEIKITCNNFSNVFPKYVEATHLRSSTLDFGNGPARDMFLDAALLILICLIERDGAVYRRRAEQANGRLRKLEISADGTVENTLLGIGEIPTAPTVFLVENTPSLPIPFMP